MAEEKPIIAYQSLAETLKQDAEKHGILHIEEKTKTGILTFDQAQERQVYYHLVPPTLDWLLGITYITPNVKSALIQKDGGLPILYGLLLNIEPEMFINLRKIIFTSEDDEDFLNIAEHMDIEACGVCEYFDYLGIFWYDESALVINIEAIESTVKEMAQSMHLSEVEANAEFTIGVYSTLVHELRHLAMENPYLDEERYPDTERSENAVENYARAVTDQHLCILQQISTQYPQLPIDKPATTESSDVTQPTPPTKTTKID